MYISVIYRYVHCTGVLFKHMLKMESGNYYFCCFKYVYTGLVCMLVLKTHPEIFVN